MKRICVFCGANSGRDPAYQAAAQELGTTLAKEKIELVFGGSDMGLMAAVANAALRAGGRAIGVIPELFIKREQAHTGLSELKVVGSMHERKALMAQLSDGFIALPGGLGTLDEFFEIATWAQLNLHAKPFGLLNVGGFFDLLLQFLDRSVAQGLILPQYREMILVDSAVPGILRKFSERHAAISLRS